MLEDNLLEVEAERHWDILGDVNADVLANPLAVTLKEGRARLFTRRILTR